MHQRAMVPIREFFTVFLAVILLGAQWVWSLSVTSYTTDSDGITCTCNTGVMKVKICQADIVRVAYFADLDDSHPAAQDRHRCMDDPHLYKNGSRRCNHAADQQDQGQGEQIHRERDVYGPQ